MHSMPSHLWGGWLSNVHSTDVPASSQESSGNVPGNIVRCGRGLEKNTSKRAHNASHNPALNKRGICWETRLPRLNHRWPFMGSKLEKLQRCRPPCCSPRKRPETSFFTVSWHQA